MPQPRPCRLFLFDLDGTLIDSREDIVRAVNAVLDCMGRPVLPFEDVIPLVGDGVESLMQRSLQAVSGTAPHEAEVRKAVESLIEWYENHLLDSTCLYPGVLETLEALRGARMGLISNKPEALVRRILDELGISGYFCVVLGGDSLPRRKPDPSPLLAAMLRCNALPSETVMIGDSRTDILAGKSAGTFTCGVSSGFRSRAELESAGCDAVIDTLRDLVKWFRAAEASDQEHGSRPREP